VLFCLVIFYSVVKDSRDLTENNVEERGGNRSGPKVPRARTWSWVTWSL